MKKSIRTEETYRADRYILTWMIIVHLLAVAGLWFFSWQNFLVMMLFNFLTGCIGITLTYHRLLTHRSFKAPAWFERFLSVFGVLALQGSPLEWVSHHRMHHADSDGYNDPHNANKGFWFSHMLWLFRIEPRFDDKKLQQRFARDLASDPFYRFWENPTAQVLLQVAVGVVLWILGGFGCMMWGIFVRLVVSYHITWLVNSATHKWGYKNYQVENNLATNNWWVGILAWGEGWHNNHHAFQQVARAGHKWWEVDMTYMIIKILESLGLAYDIKKLPDQAVLAAKSEQSSYQPVSSVAASESA